jgi:hypothetical protein
MKGVRKSRQFDLLLPISFGQALHEFVTYLLDLGTPIDAQKYRHPE